MRDIIVEKYLLMSKFSAYSAEVKVLGKALMYMLFLFSADNKSPR